MSNGDGDLTKQHIVGGCIASSGYSCWLCGEWVGYGQTHSCWSQINTLPPNTIPMTMPTIEGILKLTKDINWKEYTPAKPPEDGEYLVIAINRETMERDWYTSDYKKEDLDWVNIDALSYIVTHYVKMELP